MVNLNGRIVLGIRYNNTTWNCFIQIYSKVIKIVTWKNTNRSLALSENGTIWEESSNSATSARQIGLSVGVKCWKNHQLVPSSTSQGTKKHICYSDLKICIWSMIVSICTGEMKKIWFFSTKSNLICMVQMVSKNTSTICGNLNASCPDDTS